MPTVPVAVLSEVEAVTFDYWNTLCYEPPGGYLRQLRLMAMRPVIDSIVEFPSGLLDRLLAQAYDAAWDRYVVCWEANHQFTGLDAAQFVVDALSAASEQERLVIEGLRGELVDAFLIGSAGAELLVLDGLVEVLDALREAEIRIGIVCDVGFTASPVLREHLDGHGLLDSFDHWSFSDEVGVYKPNRKIFEHALEGLGGVPADRAVHIGDRRRTDIAGAKETGMRSIRITAVFDDADPTQGPSGDLVISSYAELLAAFG